MGKIISELGNKYNTMVVIREIPKEERPNKRFAYWELQCELCGEKRITTGAILRKQGLKCNCQRYEDLTGQTFGRLTVVRMATREERSDDQGAAWCKCSCGNPNLILVRSQSLKKGDTKSCGCLHKEKMKEIHHNNIIDLTGQRFRRLVVKRLATDEEIIQNDKKLKYTYWICDCDCGTKDILVNGTSLRVGNSKSCGCLRSYGEELINQILTNNNIDFRREYSFKDLRGDRKLLKFDFAIFDNNNLIGLIECDGQFHRYNSYKGRLEKQQQYDQLKDDYCYKYNIPLLRIKYNTKKDIKEDEILDFIRKI